MEKIDTANGTIYRWKLGASTFLVDIEKGAKLLAWDIAIAGQKRDIIYHGDGGEHSGNPILFPFAGTCSVKGENFKWQSPTGELLDMPQHGFAKDANFQIENIDKNGFNAKLLHLPEFDKYYPYNYDFYVAYNFTMFSFDVEMTLVNKGDPDLAWSAGNHFYFNVPWHEGRSRNDYICNINAKNALAYRNSKLEKVDSLKSFELSNDSQINVIHSNLRSKELTFGSKNGEENLSIRIDGSLDKHSSIVTWTKDTSSPFYCIEPWMGLPNAPEHKKGLHLLKKGDSQSFKVQVSL